MRKFLNILTAITFAVAFGLLILIGYWIVWPYKTVEFHNLPFPIDPQVVKAGDTLFYKVDYCKFTPLTPTSSKTFVNSIIYNVPSVVVLSKNPGCNKIEKVIR